MWLLQAQHPPVLRQFLADPAIAQTAVQLRAFETYFAFPAPNSFDSRTAAFASSTTF